MNVFYHIHKKNNYDEMWQIGNEFEVGKEQNPFSELSYIFPKYPTNEYDLLHEYKILVRELGMEQIRREKFNESPSRNNCIWLCRKEQIMYWKNQLEEKDVEVQEVEVFNLPVKKRGKDIPLLGMSYKETLKQAKKYWENTDLSNNEDDEYLYLGKLKIIDKLE